MNTRSTEYGSNGPQNRNPEAIARAINVTRSEVDQTLDALQARLSPGQILDRTMELMRDSGGEFASNLGRSVKDHPLPVILTGVGLAWMMSASRSEPPAGSARTSAPHATGAGERPGNLGEDVAGATSHAVSSAQEGLSGVADSMSTAAASTVSAAATTAARLSDGLTGATHLVRNQSRRMSEGFADLLREQPLLVGAMGLALGALLGYVLPATETEDRLLGEARDATVREAKEAAKAQVTRASEMVREVVTAQDDSTDRTDGQDSTSQHSSQEPQGSTQQRDRATDA